MTKTLQRSIAEYRDNTRCIAPPDLAQRILDRIGLSDRYCTVASPLGPLYVAWNPLGVSAVRQAKDAKGFERWFRQRFGRSALPATEEPAVVDDVRQALAGKRVDVNIDWRGVSPFAAAVLRKAGEIGRGHARPYSWIAREINHPRAIRAVGSALARNPVPLLIPCHRVVRSDYTCGDYAFGPTAKRQLLRDEGLDMPAIGDLVRHGFHFVAQPSHGTFCLPTCGDIMDDPQLVRVHTASEALAMGYAPCDMCRPVAAA